MANTNDIDKPGNCGDLWVFGTDIWIRSATKDEERKACGGKEVVSYDVVFVVDGVKAYWD